MYAKMMEATAFAVGAAENATLNDASYPRFADVMTSQGYDWEAIKVTTDDHYILTTFHILGKTDGSTKAATEGSVLIQHGLFEDGTSWLEDYANLNEKSFQLQLVDAGYDVWIGSNRGTEYSWEHETLSVDDGAYWEFTWAEMGMYDDPANIAAIKKATGQDKIFYIGYSQGTAQMHYALAHQEQTFVDGLHKVVHFAPCFVPNVPDFVTSIGNSTLMQFQDAGVYALLGPNWSDDLTKIRKTFGLAVWEAMKQISGETTGVQSMQYWMTNGVTDRFQEPIADRAVWLSGDELTANIDVSKIKTLPMSFFIGEDDHVCPKKQATTFIAQIQAPTNQIIVPSEGHLWFTEGANTEWFMTNLIEQLQVPTTTDKISIDSHEGVFLQ